MRAARARGNGQQAAFASQPASFHGGNPTKMPGVGLQSRRARLAFWARASHSALRSSTWSNQPVDVAACMRHGACCGQVAEWLKAHSASPRLACPGIKSLRAPRRALRTGGRVVEGARLESVYRGNSIAGSNPALSAIFSCNNLIFQGFSEAIFSNPTLSPTRLLWWAHGKIEVIPTPRRSVD